MGELSLTYNVMRAVPTSMTLVTGGTELTTEEKSAMAVVGDMLGGCCEQSADKLQYTSIPGVIRGNSGVRSRTEHFRVLDILFTFRPLPRFAIS
jgi:hypothetical protein